uniref:Coiled-coil domain containing 77 n=1 Tax=Pseudonaja textilis TaxID=8673 RepID=A0A670YAY6_PSETE
SHPSIALGPVLVKPTTTAWRNVLNTEVSILTPCAASRGAILPSPHPNDSTPLPSINERLAYLRPSRELLEYYRKKIAQFDEEHEELVKRLETYKASYDEQHKLQWEMRQREEEIAELQKALSDMQVYLFQEREHVLRLYSENDRLKIRELEDRKKIQHLLALLGTDNGEITYFHQEPPNKNLESANRRYQRDNQTLLLQLESFQAQLQEQTRLSKEQTEALLEDRRIRIEEAQVQHQRDEEKIKEITEKYHKAQNLLYESTRDFLQVKFDARANEKSWMAEKDTLLRKMDKCKCAHKQSGIYRDDSPVHYHINQSYDSCQSWRVASPVNQDTSLDEWRSSPRQQSFTKRSPPSGKQRSEKMGKRLQLMTRRYEALEKRRAMEMEGFKNDIKQFQKKLQDVEKQLFKVAKNVGPDQDLAMLHEVRRGNKRTKKLQGELKTLKSKIYGLENDLRDY